MNAPRPRFSSLLLAVALVAIALPLLCARCCASLSPEHELFDGARARCRARSTLDHYRALFHERELLDPDAQLAAGRGADHAAVRSRSASLCAYAFARCASAAAARCSARAGGLDVPADLDRVAAVSVLRELRLIDTYPGLVLPYLTFAMPLAVWLLVGFFRQLPPRARGGRAASTAPAACACCWRSSLPLAAPGLATTAILTFIYCWNEFLFALSFTLSPERQTVPVAIALFRGQYQVPWGQVLAATVVSTLPVARPRRWSSSAASSPG